MSGHSCFETKPSLGGISILLNYLDNPRIGVRSHSSQFAPLLEIKKVVSPQKGIVVVASPKGKVARVL